MCDNVILEKLRSAKAHFKGMGFIAGREVLVRMSGVQSGRYPGCTYAHVEHCVLFLGRIQYVHVYLQIHDH